jgi:hypothetical protein
MSSSGSEAGRELDEEVEHKKPEKVEKLERPKVTNEIAQPIPSKPLITPSQPRLSRDRREQIIAEFEAGKEDSEHEVKKLSNGTYRVSKRKTFYTPSASVENGRVLRTPVTKTVKPPPAEPPKEDLQLTWVNMLNERDNDLKGELAKLHKKYKKLAKRYEQNVPLMPPPPNVQLCHRVPDPPKAKAPLYKVPKKMDIRDF